MGFDVEEMTFLPDGSLIFAARTSGAPSALYLADRNSNIRLIAGGEKRYPAASPDGRWLAYSELDAGVWNLQLRDLQNGQTRRLTNAACNDMTPAWEPDSATLIYASDCGRALWFTALYRRRVVP
jgi:Tol biopolymer transport system component